MEWRTDLALEVSEIHAEKGRIDGIITKEETVEDIRITTISIDESAEKLTCKQAGEYITLDIGKIWQAESEVYNKTATVIGKKIEELLPEGNGCILVIGLGNSHITADALGPMALEGLIVTHHIKILNNALYKSIGFGDVSALAPGVLGQTGLESSELIKAAVDYLEPLCVIVIDALASRRLARLATTVQLTDTGISPGSGVFNSRAAVNSSTMGVPVISVGIPTVVDAATLAADVFVRSGNSDADIDTLTRALSEDARSFFVTPKETDTIVASCAKLISVALNLALHKTINIADIPDYLT